MTTTNPYIQSLLDTNPLREPVLRSVIQALALPDASQGIDVGCGIGLPAFLLAEAVGTQGHVTGVDILPELLEFGRVLAAKAGLSDRVTFREGEMSALPFDDNAFDWAWSADCVGYPAGDVAPLLAELARVVKPGGIIALVGWTSQQVLPGYSLLEARLNATCSGYIPFLRDKPPEQQFLRALACFRTTGLQDIQARTFIGDVTSPLDTAQRTALVTLFQMLWGERRPEVLPEDWAAYQRLCTPASPDFILNIPDYYAFIALTMFVGQVQ